MMKKSTESGVVKACLQLLQLHGIYCWRQNQGAIPLSGGGFRRFVGLKGVADIIGIAGGKLGRGRFLAVEVKKPGGRLSKKQKAFLAAVEERGGYAVCVDNVADLESWLRDLDII